MSQTSPTLEGFRVVFRRPSLALAEISWRWAFGSAAVVLVVLSFFEYLDTLPVSRGDLLLLKSKQPALISRGLQHTLSGSAMRATITFIVLSVGLSVGWAVLSALGRSATLQSLLDHSPDGNTNPDVVASDRPKPSLRRLIALNFFRVVAILAAVLACLAALLIASLASSPRHPKPEVAALILMTIPVVVWLAWSGINWYLSLAAVFVVARAQDTFSALASAVDMCRDRTGAVATVGTWFGLAHLGLFMIASIAVVLPLGLVTVLPVRLIVVGILLLTLVYFAVADSLYIGRLAAYIAILELPSAAMPILPVPVYKIQQPTINVAPSESIDRDEVILSDIPDTHDE